MNTTRLSMALVEKQFLLEPSAALQFDLWVAKLCQSAKWKEQSGVIVTHVDKASKFLVAGLGQNKSVVEVNQVTIELFKSVAETQRKTMIFDNGKEFSGHAQLSQELGLSCYFANPYYSWERGLNEHTNGLLRQFFPKKTNFKWVEPEALENAVTLINDRPRRSLDYKTPSEVFYAGKSDTDALQI